MMKPFCLKLICFFKERQAKNTQGQNSNLCRSEKEQPQVQMKHQETFIH